LFRTIKLNIDITGLSSSRKLPCCDTLAAVLLDLYLPKPGPALIDCYLSYPLLSNCEFHINAYSINQGIKKRQPFFVRKVAFYGGGDRSRTGVQTYSPKAFYMFISSLFVGTEQETNTPIQYVAGWS